MTVVREIEVFAGSSEDAIARLSLEEIQQNFCLSQAEFNAEYPGDQGRRYLIQLTVTPVILEERPVPIVNCAPGR